MTSSFEPKELELAVTEIENAIQWHDPRRARRAAALRRRDRLGPVWRRRRPERPAAAAPLRLRLPPAHAARRRAARRLAHAPAAPWDGRAQVRPKSDCPAARRHVHVDGGDPRRRVDQCAHAHTADAAAGRPPRLFPFAYSSSPPLRLFSFFTRRSPIAQIALPHNHNSQLPPPACPPLSAKAARLRHRAPPSRRPTSPWPSAAASSTASRACQRARCPPNKRPRSMASRCPYCQSAPSSRCRRTSPRATPARGGSSSRA